MSGAQVQIVDIGVLPKGAEITLAWDFSNFVDTNRKNTSVSSATATTDCSAVTVGTPTTAINVVTVTLTAAQTGRGIIKVTATLADTNIWPVYWRVEVVDPTCGDEASDYGG